MPLPDICRKWFIKTLMMMMMMIVWLMRWPFWTLYQCFVRNNGWELEQADPARADPPRREESHHEHAESRLHDHPRCEISFHLYSHWNLLFCFPCGLLIYGPLLLCEPCGLNLYVSLGSFVCLFGLQLYVPCDLLYFSFWSCVKSSIWYHASIRLFESRFWCGFTLQLI